MLSQDKDGEVKLLGVTIGDLNINVHKAIKNRGKSAVFHAETGNDLLVIKPNYQPNPIPMPKGSNVHYDLLASS